MDLMPYLTKVKYQENDDIILAKNGDKAAFERLIIANESSLYRVAKGILENKEDAEDVYQETFIKAYRGIVNLKKNEYFKTWLIRIIINQCTLLLKKRRKTVHLSEVNNFEMKQWITVKVLNYGSQLSRLKWS